jgi:hypothetical protein
VPAEIVRKRDVGGKTQLDVTHDVARYVVWITPARGMNQEVVGYRAWIGNATLLHQTEEAAINAALRAIERIRTPRRPSPAAS